MHEWWAVNTLSAPLVGARSGAFVIVAIAVGRERAS
jgi:hypothetical protein